MLSFSKAGKGDLVLSSEPTVSCFVEKSCHGYRHKVLLLAVWCCKSCECCFVPWWEQGCADVFLGTTVSDGWYRFPACLGFQCWRFDLLVAPIRAVQRKHKCITRCLQCSPSLAGEFPRMLINASAVPGICQKSVFILVS